MKKTITIGIIIAVIIIAAAFYLYSTQSSAPEEKIISIKNLQFNPAVTNIATGDKITWKNEDSFTHDVTIDNGLFDKDIEAGQSFSYTFNEAGTYEYHCDIHPSMKGTIIVK